MTKKTIPKAVLAELQRQMNHELSAAHGYLAMSLWCASENLDGFARFFSKQEGEEREHARKIMDHLLDRGALPEVQAVAAPGQKYDSLLQVALQAQEMEQANTKGIYAVYEAALAAKDYPAQVLMHWFINEQVEEEAWCAELIDRVQQATCAGSVTQLNRHIEKDLAGNGDE